MVKPEITLKYLLCLSFYLLMDCLRTNRKLKSQNSTYMREGNHRASSDSRCIVEVHPGL